MTVSKEVYQNRKNNHLCTKCGKQAVIDRTLCLYHLENANRNQKAVVARRKVNGQCPLCGGKLNNNRKTCNDCLDKNVSKQRDDVWVPHKNRTRSGLCLDCGKKKVGSNLYCRWCAKKRINNQTSIRQINIAKGLCGVCGKRLLTVGKKRCIICTYKHKTWYATSITRTQNIERNQLLKERVIQHYGGKCSCCRETERTFLAIDHINGKGNVHRKKIKKSSGSAFYKWIISQNFPDDLQILCHNCNMSKHLLGECAHKQKD